MGVLGPQVNKFFCQHLCLSVIPIVLFLPQKSYADRWEMLLAQLRANYASGQVSGGETATLLELLTHRESVVAHATYKILLEYDLAINDFAKILTDYERAQVQTNEEYGRGLRKDYLSKLPNNTLLLNGLIATASQALDPNAWRRCALIARELVEMQKKNQHLTQEIVDRPLKPSDYEGQRRAEHLRSRLDNMPSIYKSSSESLVALLEQNINSLRPIQQRIASAYILTVLHRLPMDPPILSNDAFNEKFTRMEQDENEVMRKFATQALETLGIPELPACMLAVVPKPVAAHH